MAERYYVLFRSSFRFDAAPNISHETIDKVRTLCGRKVADAESLESDSNDLEPDCLRCQRALARSNKPQPEPEPEAQLKCETCSPGHRLGSSRKPCGVPECECWCNRVGMQAARAKETK